MVDLSEVAERVAVLEHFPFEDDQPNIEAPSLAVLYDGYTDYNLSDRGAYDTRWTEETQAISQLREIIKQGDEYINMLYTYRSCSKALPQVKTSDQSNKNEIYEATYEVLEPEIKKLKNFMYFRRDTTKAFCEHVKKLGVWLIPDKKGKLKEDYTPSETYLWYMIQLLDRFALLDALKNMKACFNNDFSFYKRAFGFLRKNMTGNDDQTQENHTLYLFLAHQNSITTDLKTELQTIPGFDDVLAVIVETCADFLEANRYMLPSEKHCLLRVMPFVLFLMDGEQNTQFNIFKSKKIKLNRYSSIFKKYPIVPLYGDMMITLDSTVKRSPHFDEKSWGSSETEQKLVSFYEIVNHLESTRQLHNDFLARFSNVINEIKAVQREGKPVGFVIAKEVTSTVLQGFQYLSDWTDKVLQQSAWKYAKPNNDPKIESTVDYERVVRFNYKPEEKFALVEFIAMIKGLANVMLKEDGLLSPILRSCIHDEVQEYIQIGLRDLIRVATKKKKKEIRQDLIQLRTIAADWFSGTEPADPVLQGKKSKENERIQIPSRAVGPSPTQLELIRSVTFGLLYRKKEHTSSQIKVLEDFYNRSFFYSYLLNYTGTIINSSDLGDLWYREFYLELSKRLQFPIDMSLPWILTDHILESRDPAMIEFVFYPLDLYNDSANRALNSLHQQFLYDEIEAEVNLCFDQLVYKLSEQIYVHFKSHAASVLLDKPYKTQLETIYAAHRLNVPKGRYDVLLAQRHINLLGRSIDLNSLISQRMNTYLRQNIDHAIGRFEASDISSIVELENLLSNIRFTYNLLREYFELDPWESILTEVNESTSLVSFHGRIILHVIFELVYDFGPNWVYNSITNRFIRTTFSFAPEVPREPMPKTNPTFLYGSKVLNGAYANAVELYKNFFGMQHITSLLHLVGRSNIPLIVSECLQNMDIKLRSTLVPYVRELMGGLPGTKLPIHDYGTEGGYGYFQLKLKDIITYPDLRPEVLQNFREMGNNIIFLRMCDFGLSQTESMRFLVSAPFLGVTADKNLGTNDPSASSPLYTATHGLASTLETKPQLAKAPGILRELVNNAWKADKFYRAPSQNISLFKSVLQKISAMFDSVRGEWMGGAPENGIMSVDTTTEFYRLWSALQFVCSLPTGDNELSNYELFGDGLFWAGCSIIHFMGQQSRFEVFDFSYHILNVEEGASVPCNNPLIHGFFKKVAQIRDLNQSIFNTLRAYCPPPAEDVLVLHPPETDLSESQFISVGDAPSKQGITRVASVTKQTQDNYYSRAAEDFPPPPPPSDMGMAPPPPPDFDVPPPPPPRDF